MKQKIITELGLDIYTTVAYSVKQRYEVSMRK